jgi:hypothetical protein
MPAGAGGIGARYLVAAKYGLRLGIDVTHGDDERSTSASAPAGCGRDQVGATRLTGRPRPSSMNAPASRTEELPCTWDDSPRPSA